MITKPLGTAIRRRRVEGVMGRQERQRRDTQDEGTETGRRKERWAASTLSKAKRSSTGEIGRDRRRQPFEGSQHTTLEGAVAKRFGM